MKLKSYSERGQALIFIALAAIGIFAIVGLAIDGSSKFSDQRHAQNAADTAALAGALSLVNGNITEINGVPVWKIEAYNRAFDNGYDGDLLTNTVEVYLCSDVASSCGPYAGNSKYVQVIINSYVNTFFARVIGVDQVHNRVQAVTYASKRGPQYDGNLIVALNPNPCDGQNGNVVLGGNSNVVLNGGGAFVNSGGDSCGMEQGGSCPTIINGELSSTGNGNINMGTCTIPTPNYDSEPYPYPPEMPDEPDECDISNPGTFSNNNGITYLNPGRYNEFPPKSGGGVTVYDNMIMNPGIYCVDDVVKLQDHNLVLTGHDVTLFIRSGHDIDIQGGTITLDAPDTGPYAGYLIIVDSDFTGTVPDCHINGDSSNTYEGTIFTPYCDLIINGGNDTTTYSSQMIGYTVTILGNATTNLNYVQGQNAQSEPKIGLMR